MQSELAQFLFHFFFGGGGGTNHAPSLATKSPALAWKKGVGPNQASVAVSAMAFPASSKAPPTSSTTLRPGDAHLF